MFVSALLVLPAFGQNGINSPYSRYGVGQLNDFSVGINKAMGGVGIGLRERNTLNTLNPASYSTVDTLTFLFDAGMSLTHGNFEENGVRVNANNANFDYLAMQFRIVRNLGFTMSLLPYSNVGYTFSETSAIRNDNDGELSATNSYAGTGGLRQLSAGLGWAPLQYLSVGMDVGYIFGEFTHIISNKYSDSSILTRSKTYYSEMKGLRMNFGLQASCPLAGGTLTAGAVFAPATNFNGDGMIYDEMIDGTTSDVSDTLSLYDKFSISSKLGAGLSYSHGKWMAEADFSYEKWSNATFFGENGLRGKDRVKLSIGGMFQPEKNDRKLFRRTAYRAGVFMSQPYFYIGENAGPTEYGASVGMSLPIINTWNNMIEVNVSGQFVHVSPSLEGMVTENYMRLSIGVAFNERWFTKWKVE